jgi:RNA polymerase sigma factor (sigma-70 family)
MIPSTHLSLLKALQDEGQWPAAWERFQKRYQETLFRWCLRRGLQAADAEDVTQAVLTRLFQSLPHHEHDPARRFRRWLKAVVNNAIRDLERAARRHPADRAIGGSDFQERLGQVEALDDLAEAIEGHVDAALEEAVRRVKARVAEVTWQAFWRHVVDELPVGEVAQELGFGEGSVYQAKARVRRMLAEEYLGKDGKEL